MSMPFINKEFTFTQPDGTQLRVRGTGDQYGADFTTLDGSKIVRDPVSGFYHHAIADRAGTLSASGFRADIAPPQPLDQGVSTAATTNRQQSSPGLPRSELSRWQIRRRDWQSAMHMSVAAGTAPPIRRPVLGQYVGLCLLVQFPDVPGVMTQNDVDAFCNQNNYSGFGNNGSVRDYYFDNSDGKLTYTNIVAPYYTAQHPRSYYTDSTIAYPQRAQELVQETLAYHSASGFDFSHLSSDSGNYIFAVNLFYAGDCINKYTEGLWPHSWHLQQPYNVAPTKLASDYQITNMGSALTLGTFCHENGHMICDFPDLYAPSPDTWNGVGTFCIMAYGGIDPNEKNPAQICGYLKHSVGWTNTASVISPSSHYALQAGHNEFAISGKHGTEYFIIENRQCAGRDSGISSSGLAVWHVNESGSNYDIGNSPAQQRECALVQADGNQTIDDGTDLYPDGSNNHLSDLTTPSSKWLDGSSSGIDIRNISAAGPRMTFVT